MKNVLNKVIDFFSVPQKFFVFWGAIGGLIFSMLIPVLQTPDELTHFKRMCEAYGAESIYNETTADFIGGTNLPGVIREYDNKVDSDAYFESGSQSYDNGLSVGDFSLGVHTIRYLPFAIGFFLSSIIGMPILLCFQIGEFFSILFFLFVGYYAIKIIPVKKYLMMFWLLSPMVLQQCSSINYDAVLIPVCFFLTAYIIRCKLDDSKVGWKNLLIIAALLLVILLIKPPYVLIGGLLLTIPLSKFNLKLGKLEVQNIIKKYRFIIIPVLIVLALVGAYVMRNNSHIKFIYITIRRPDEILRLFKQSFLELNHYYIYTTVGAMGWLETIVSVPFEIIFFVVMTYLFIKDGDSSSSKKENENGFTKLNSVWIVLLVLAMFLFIFLSMLTWSFYVYDMDRNVPVNIYFDYIARLTRFDGIQGRYFIPFIPMLLLAFRSKGEGISRRASIGLSIYYLISYYYLFELLLGRFWIA